MPRRFLLGLRTALFLAISISVVACGVLVHLSWRQTAMAVSGNLLNALEERIADATRREWWLGITGLERRVAALATALAGRADPTLRAASLAEAARGEGGFAWLAFLPDVGEPLLAQAADGPSASASAGGWTAAARGIVEAGWIRLAPPAGGEPGAAYVVRIAGGSVIGAVTDRQLGRQLGEIPVGRSGGTFVLASDGAVVIAAQHPEMSGARQPAPALLQAAGEAGRVVAARAPRDRDTPETRRLTVGGETYAVGLSPLWFQGWQMAIILPEADYLGDVEKMIARVSLGLAAFVLVAGGIAAWATRALVATPIRLVAEDLTLIERFELEGVPRRYSYIAEIDRLSEAIGRMSAGLADFGKFIPTELVRRLITDGMRAEPGGSRREISVLFADLAGFTALSEKLGDAAVPIVGRFLDLASSAIAEEGGTVDKYIGDAVMAFWGAPGAEPEHALRACRAALAIRDGFERLRREDPRFAALGLRIGLQSGPAIVGNVGSARRLNYTALGDTVNLASRLEGVNKIYRTVIALGPGTRDGAGEGILVRELDSVAVYGRAEGVKVYELVGLAGMAEPVWLAPYAEGLKRFRAADFAGAIRLLDGLLAVSPDDGPALRLVERARGFLQHPPGPGWRALTSLDMK